MLVGSVSVDGFWVCFSIHLFSVPCLTSKELPFPFGCYINMEMWRLLSNKVQTINGLRDSQIKLGKKLCELMVRFLIKEFYHGD